MRYSIATLLLSCLTATAAQASDMDFNDAGTQGAGHFYGNLHGTLGTDFSSSSSAFHALPWINYGAKFAYEGAPGEWGSQLDVDYSSQDLAWAQPSISPLSGNSTAWDAAAHATYMLGQDKKLGLFAGYSMLDTYMGDSTGLMHGGLTQLSTTAGLVGLGAEGLWAVNDQTSLQLRAAVMTPIYTKLMTNSGLGAVYTGNGQFDFSQLGYMVAAGANHEFTPNWSMRADVDMLNVNVGNSSSNLIYYGGNLGLQYTFDLMPLSIGAQAGYLAKQWGGYPDNDYSLATKLTYSFGGPSQGAQGKLFRSGMLGMLY